MRRLRLVLFLVAPCAPLTFVCVCAGHSGCIPAAGGSRVPIQKSVLKLGLGRRRSDVVVERFRLGFGEVLRLEFLYHDLLSFLVGTTDRDSVTSLEHPVRFGPLVVDVDFTTTAGALCLRTSSEETGYV